MVTDGYQSIGYKCVFVESIHRCTYGIYIIDVVHIVDGRFSSSFILFVAAAAAAATNVCTAQNDLDIT